jgi:hypothetical protein
MEESYSSETSVISQETDAPMKSPDFATVVCCTVVESLFISIQYRQWHKYNLRA